jgi:GT2 family glycosyltransferase
MKTAVIITTYNQPEWLWKTLYGYAFQSDAHFEIVIADDGSDKTTREVIDSFRDRLSISHVWHEDLGFRKTAILNKAIMATRADYLIFTDGDCVPRADFVEAHRRLAREGCYLSAGYFKLTGEVSQAAGESDIESGRLFEPRWLRALGQPWTYKFLKFTAREEFQWVLNRVSGRATQRYQPSFNGCNSSAFRFDLLRVNGFDERMRYGGLDRELGCRLVNAGIRPVQARYSACVVHLHHARGYENQEDWDRNLTIRAEVCRTRAMWTEYGIIKGPPQIPVPGFSLKRSDSQTVHRPACPHVS